MIIFLGSLLLFLITLIIVFIFDHPEDSESKVLALLFSAIVFLIALFAIPISRYDMGGNIVEFKQTEISLNWARQNENINPIELAAIQQKVIESNQWLVRKKYQAERLLENWYVCPEIKKLQPIK